MTEALCFTTTVSLTQSNFGFHKLTIKPNKASKTVKATGTNTTIILSTIFKEKTIDPIIENINPGGMHKAKCKNNLLCKISRTIT